MFYIGLDPGLSRTGIVLVHKDYEDNFNILYSRVASVEDIIPTLSHIKLLCHPDYEPIYIIIEVPVPYATVPSTIMHISYLLGWLVYKLSKIFHGKKYHLIPMCRQHVKSILLGTVRGKDRDIREAVLDYFYIERSQTRKLGLKADIYSALALVAAFTKEPYYYTQIESEWAKLFTIVQQHVVDDANIEDDSERFINEVMNDGMAQSED